MSDEKVLTKEIAEQFLAGQSVTLNEFTAIEDEAAESLRNCNHTWLVLDGLTNLSDAAAIYLSTMEIALSLNGLTELSNTAAKSLGKHALVLSGLTSLKPANIPIDAAGDSKVTRRT
jgi:hypothetical protein